MKRTVFLVFLAACIMFSAHAGTPTQSGFKDNSVAMRTRLTNGKDFTVTVIRSVWPEKSYLGAQLWGSYGKKPALVISSIKAKSNGEDILVPFSAYSDLAEPNRVVLRDRGKNVDVEISGGEGGDSYTATITFESGRYIVQRRVVSRVMPKDAFEESKYQHIRD